MHEAITRGCGATNVHRGQRHRDKSRPGRKMVPKSTGVQFASQSYARGPESVGTQWGRSPEQSCGPRSKTLPVHQYIEYSAAQVWSNSSRVFARLIQGGKRWRRDDGDGDVHVEMRVRKKVQSFRRASCEALVQAPGAQQALPAWSSNARARNGSRSSTTRS